MKTSRLLLTLFALVSCRCGGPKPPEANAGTGGTGGTGAGEACVLVEGNPGPTGTISVRAETVVAGLEVPWALAFLPDGDFLVTERPGRVRLFQAGALVPGPVIEFDDVEMAEGGLLGLALHPDFARNRLLYLYRTTPGGNQVERWRLSDDARSATFDRVILAGITSAKYHDGGRIRFGPDGMLYVGTGDSTNPARAQDRESLNGKLLRVDPDGGTPADNPFPGSPVFLSGIRNTQGFDWKDGRTLYVTDHGPSGELNLRGLDEVNVARAGENLGWPEIQGCETRDGMITPSLTWGQSVAVPPGGAAVYTGAAIPEWRGSLLVGVLGARHLQRVVFEASDERRISSHEVYFAEKPPQGLGRIREVIMGPDGALWLTTSNCDGRGDCPPDKDRVVRIVR